ncbi:MAG: hypothetical protein Q9195_008374 [Heterodermia aff. obscurata]
MANNSAAHFRRRVEETKEIFRSFRNRFGFGKKTSHTARTSLAQLPQGICLLYNLPPEIILLFCSFLDDASIVLLSYTSKALQGFLKLNPASFSRCVRWVVTCRLEQGALILAQAGKQPPPKELCCMACKRKHPSYMFDGTSYRKLFPSSAHQFFDQPFLGLSPAERICGLTRPKIDHITDTTTTYNFLDPAGQPITMAERTWLQIPILTCTHCGEGVSMAAGEPVCRNPFCGCTACLKVLKPTYLRFGPLFARVLDVERFRYDSKGRLRVVERGAGPYEPPVPVREVANPFHRPAAQ